MAHDDADDDMVALKPAVGCCRRDDRDCAFAWCRGDDADENANGARTNSSEKNRSRWKVLNRRPCGGEKARQAVLYSDKHDSRIIQSRDTDRVQRMLAWSGRIIVTFTHQRMIRFQSSEPFDLLLSVNQSIHQPKQAMGHNHVCIMLYIQHLIRL